MLLRTLESRRRVLLCAFGALCVLPTLLTAGWSLIRNWPAKVAREADRLAERLGVLVELSAVRHPRPGLLVYEGLKLADPETGRALLQCRTLEVQWRKVAAADGQLRQVAVVIAAEPHIDGRAVERLWSIVARALAADPAAGNTDVRIWACSARLQIGTQVYQLGDVHCGTESAAAGNVAAASFRLAGNDSSHLVRMRWLRDRREEAIAEQFELDTGGASIPCSLLAAAAPELRRLGTNSTFQGRFWLRWPAQRSAEQRCHGELVGQLAAVDLSALTTGLGSYKLAGTADVWIQYARIADGRLKELSCVLQGGPGIISRRLRSRNRAFEPFARNGGTGFDRTAAIRPVGVCRSPECRRSSLARPMRAARAGHSAGRRSTVLAWRAGSAATANRPADPTVGAKQRRASAGHIGIRMVDVPSAAGAQRSGVF